MDDRLLTTPCTLVSYADGTADVYGDATPSETSVSAFCHYEQAQSGEVEGEAVERSQWRVFLSGNVTPPRGSDRIVIGGASYALMGDAWPAIRPTTGLVDHVECLVERVR